MTRPSLGEVARLRLVGARLDLDGFLPTSKPKLLHQHGGSLDSITERDLLLGYGVLSPGVLDASVPRKKHRQVALQRDEKTVV
jgi:hypothetical protein